MHKKFSKGLLLVVTIMGCQQAPVTRPRILSVQTPSGVPNAPPLNTTRTNPLIVPTAPVGTVTGGSAVIAAPATVVQPPPGATAPGQVIQVPAVPGGVQGFAPPNTISNKPKAYYQPQTSRPREDD